MFEKLKGILGKKEKAPGAEPSKEDLKKVEAAVNENPDVAAVDKPAVAAPASSKAGSSVELTKISTEMDRMKASIESFGEVRKSLTERISGLSEQIGELRAMIMDRDRSIQELELKAVKAADLVETVQPEKLMIEIQRENAKFEALKANLEGNEAIMDRVMEELRELRKKMDFFRGIEEIVKLSEEVKKELVDIKKVEASIKINADKVNTIYSELRKKYKDVDLFDDSLQEFKVSLHQNTKDLDSMKVKIAGLADKSEVEKLMGRVEKYTESLKELNKRSALTKDLNQLKKLLDSVE